MTSAVQTMCAFDAGFAIGAGKLEGRLPPGRTSFPLERLDVLQSLAGEDPLIALSHRLDTFTQVELAARMHNPDVLSSLGEWLMTAMFAPFQREEERFSIVRMMLQELPFYIAEAVSTMGPCDALALQAAAEVATPFADIFDALAQVARARAATATADAIDQANVRARAAIKDFRRALQDARTVDRKPVLGSDRFAELCRLRALPMDVHEIEALGEERFAKAKEQRAEAIRRLTGYTDLKSALRGLNDDSAPQPLEELLDICRRAREFIGSNDLMPLPSDESLDIIQTPAFARALIPFAAIITPKPLWPVQRSLYYVTRAGSRADMRNAAVHEAYPGHHLQFAVANTEGSLVRNLQWTHAHPIGVETTEGWAHYCEAFMHGQGFHHSLADRVWVLNASVWRAARVLLDVRLQCGRISRDEAAQMLVDEVGLAPAAAAIEVRQYCLHPGYFLSYSLGKHMIRELRQTAERVWGNKYSLRRFHWLIMTHGQAPLAWASERIEKQQW